MASFIEIPLSKIKPSSWENYKDNSQKTLKALENNIRNNGQLENLIVREVEDGYYEVVNGNHRLQVLQKLGAEKAVVCNVGVISTTDAKYLAVQTNETHFQSDPQKLEHILEDISKDYSIDAMATVLNFPEFELFTLKLSEMPSLASADFNEDMLSVGGAEGESGEKASSYLVIDLDKDKSLKGLWFKFKADLKFRSEEDGLLKLLQYYYKEV